MSDPHIPEASSSPEAKDAEASDAVDAMESSDGSESDEDSASPRARSSYVVDNESGVALLLETRCRHGASSTLVSAWRCGKLVWEHQIRGSVEHTTVAQGFVAFATRTALHLLSTVGGYALFPPMDRNLALQLFGPRWSNVHLGITASRSLIFSCTCSLTSQRPQKIYSHPGDPILRGSADRIICPSSRRTRHSLA